MSYSQLLGPKRIIDGCTRKDQHDIGYVFMNLIFTLKNKKKQVLQGKNRIKKEKKRKEKVVEILSVGYQHPIKLF